MGILRIQQRKPKRRKEEEREKRITWRNNTPAKKDGTSMLLQMIEEKIQSPRKQIGLKCP